MEEQFDMADALERYANMRKMADALYAEARALASDIEAHARTAGINRYKGSGYMLRLKQDIKVMKPDDAMRLYPQLVRTKVEPDVRAIKSAIDTGGSEAKEKLAEIFDIVERHEIVKDYTKGGQVEI